MAGSMALTHGMNVRPVPSQPILADRLTESLLPVKEKDVGSNPTLPAKAGLAQSKSDGLLSRKIWVEVPGPAPSLSAPRPMAGLALDERAIGVRVPGGGPRKKDLCLNWTFQP